MKKIFCAVVLGALAFAGPVAMAQIHGGAAKVRMYAPDFACESLQQSVRYHGAVIIYSTQHVYDRYVASRSYCSPNEIVRMRSVPAADNSQCYAGLVCRRYSRH